ncbi:MAG: FAD:protein FMN transferase [Myxococcota bacterium]
MQSFSYNSKLGVAVLAVAVAIAGCDTKPAVLPPSDEVTARRQDHMSTYVTISVAAPESPKVLAAIDAAFSEIKRLEALVSEWRPTSEISKVNDAAGRSAVKVSFELFGVIETANEVARASRGAFDITVAAFSGLWDFHSLKPELPTDAEVAKRLELIGYRRVRLDAKTYTVELEKRGMRIGLGGIAKGHAVDGASRVLEEHGFVNHLIVAGGDLYASGRKASRKWNIGVRSPDGQGIYATLEVENEGVATSGNYERFFIHGGKRYHHILNPETGHPARGVSSATIIAKNATLADAYATAVFVRGMRDGLALAADRPGVEALLFDDETFTAHATPAMDARLERVEPGSF